MRPQVVSGSRGHYDALIRAIEREGLAVIPALSTFMDNREACGLFFSDGARPRVSQVVSLTGFSFVGGPAMNDSEAAVEFMSKLGVPLRSLVSLDVQTIENWRENRLGLNPVQTAMQVAIPEIDGATEPFVFGGMSLRAGQPEPVRERCERIARRLARWNRLRVAPREELRLALVLFCFPPDKGNIGTAADLDVFPSLFEILNRLKADGYAVEIPEDA
jgi:magnesium chelatase subunit H